MSLEGGGISKFLENPYRIYMHLITISLLLSGYMYMYI